MGAFRNHRLLQDLIHKKMHVIYLCNKEQKIQVTKKKKKILQKKINNFYADNFLDGRLISREKMVNLCKNDR